MATPIGTATLFFTGDLSALTASMNKMKSQAALAGKEAGGSFGAQFGVQLSSSLQGLIGATGAAGIAALVGKTTIEMARMGEQLQRQRAYFDAWSGSSVNAKRNLDAMREAIGGAATESDMLTAANKFLGMGLATNAEELAKHARMAVMLGGSTRTAAQAMDEWAIMLANQSVERLDTFNISSGQARVRIDELMKANKDLTREQAFLTAAWELGTAKAKMLADAGVSATGAFDALAVAAADAKAALAEMIAPHLIPLVDDLAKRIRNNLIPNLEYLFKIKPAENAYAAAFEKYADSSEAVTRAQYLLNQATATGNEYVIERAKRALTAAEKERDAAAAAYEGAQAAMSGTQANKDLASSFDGVAASAAKAGGAIAMMSTVPTALSGPGFMSTNQYGEPEAIQLGDIQRAYEDDRTGRVQQWLDRWEAQQKTTNTGILNEWKSASSDIVGLFSGGQSASIGLKDMRPGRGDMFAPGANGAFEDIYRLQAWINDSSHGDVAARFGITSKEDAAERVRKFQTGMWDESVTGLIDQDKLQQAVIDEKQAAAFKQAFAQKIAAATGENMDVVSATIYGDASGNSAAQSQKMTAAGTDMAGGLIRGVVKAQPDLETEGYNAAMSYRNGWNRGMTENTTPPTGTKPPGAGVTGKLRSTGSQE